MKKMRVETGVIVKVRMKSKSYEAFDVQLIVAILLSMSGITLLFSGFWIDPQGLIDNSVLVAFGEISTFAGALFGVDYSYKLKINN